MTKSFILPSFAPPIYLAHWLLSTIWGWFALPFPAPERITTTRVICVWVSAICLPHRVAHLNPRSVYLDRSRKLGGRGGVVKRKMLFVGRKDGVVHFNPNLFIVCQLLVLNGPLMPILTMRRQVGRLVIRQKIAGGATRGREGKGRFSSH